MAAEETATFAVKLKDETSDVAKGAANALENLRQKIERDTAALAQMQKAMRNLKGGSSVNIAAFKDLRAKIAAQKEAIAQASAAYVNLGGKFDGLKPKADDATTGLADFASVAQSMRGPLGGLVSRLSQVKGIMAAGALGAAVLVVAAAFVALAAAVVAATAALLKYGVAAADARRNERLMLEGTTRTINWWGIAHDKATDLQAAIDKVSGSSALGRDKIVGLAQSLYSANVRGENLKLALEGLTTVTSVAGEAQAAMYRDMMFGAMRVQGGIKRVSDDIKARFGGVARAQMLSVDVQSRKLRENIGRIFGDLKIEGFLDALKQVTDLFSQTTVTGRALKFLVENLLNPLLRQLEVVGPIVKRFFQGMVLAALTLGIAILKVRNWFKRTFGSSDLLKGFDSQRAAFEAGTYALYGIAIAVGAVAAAFALWAATMAAPIVAFVWLQKKSREWGESLRAFNWRGLGFAISEGITHGIKSGAKWVIDAIQGLGADAMKAFKAKLGIASPSRLFFGFGRFTAQGYAGGVRRETRNVRREVAQMVDVRAGMRAGAEARVQAEPLEPMRLRARSFADLRREREPQASPAAASVTITGNHFHFGPGTPKEHAESFLEQVGKLLEGVNITIGGKAPVSA